MNPSTSRKGKFIRLAADCGIILLLILVIALPLYISWGGSKLSYTPEPEFPAARTNSPISAGDVRR